MLKYEFRVSSRWVQFASRNLAFVIVAGGLAGIVERRPTSVAVEMEEWQANVGPLRSALGNNSPESEESESEFAGKRQYRLREFAFFGKPGNDEQQQRLMWGNAARALHLEVRGDFEPVFFFEHTGFKAYDSGNPSQNSRSTRMHHSAEERQTCPLLDVLAHLNAGRPGDRWIHDGKLSFHVIHLLIRCVSPKQVTA